MENARLDDVTQTLQDEEERLGNELAEAKDQVARLEDDLKRVEAALKALGVAKKSGRGIPKKPAPSRDDVVKALSKLLRDKTDWDREELKTEAEKKLVEAGCSRVGFSLRFKEALPSFEKAGGKLLQDRPDTISIDP